jgi:hypothetical protein
VLQVVGHKKGIKERIKVVDQEQLMLLELSHRFAQLNKL